ncbi:OmpA family protein [Roseovarius sp. SCSIO 43702]|nr:OmpA family protein [Roseovarius sp. SCSIO 43702]
MILWAGQAIALDLRLPGSATLTREIDRNPESYDVPIGPWEEGVVPAIPVKGQVTFQTWRLASNNRTTLSIMGDLVAQLDAAGYETLLRCAGRDCGGFDFRFGIEVLSAPDMFVDLFDYRFLSARRNGGPGERYVTLLVSRSDQDAYIQIVLADPQGKTALSVESDGTVATSEPARSDAGAGAADGGNVDGGPAPSDPARALVERGHVVLGDLDFGTGAAELGEGPFGSLESLAAFLKADPSRRVALVGHTDVTGNVDLNIRLSRERARAVLERLVERHGVPRGQLEAEGMGYLAPIAPNLTPAGREANRRVEAVLLNTE